MDVLKKGYKIIHPIAKTLICGDVGIGAMEGTRLQKVKNEGFFPMINSKSPILLIFRF